jgi:hypothetical protein
MSQFRFEPRVCLLYSRSVETLQSRSGSYIRDGELILSFDDVPSLHPVVFVDLCFRDSPVFRIGAEGFCVEL